MLKRFSVIQGIGAYADCAAGSVELKKTSLIFGYNSYGKSTLSELLRSLETGDTTEIKARPTIPGPVSQKAVLKFGKDGAPETALCLDAGTWQSSLPDNLRFQVFDSAFVTRNLFSGLRPERSNREAFSKFVLGEQGVTKANQIAELRRKLALARSSVRDLNKQLESVGDVDAFVAMQVTETAEALKTKVEPLILKLSQVRSRLTSYLEIQKRATLEPIKDADGPPDEFERLNQVLGESLDSTHGEIRDRVVQHLRLHMAGDRGANEWLRQGLSYIKTDKCPFCEQDLKNAPDALIDIYRRIFDEAFRQHIARVLAQLSQTRGQLMLWGMYSQAGGVDRDAAILASYKELDSDIEFVDLQREFALLGGRVKAARDTYSGKFLPVRAAAEQAIEAKRAAPNDSVGQVPLGEYQSAYAELNSAVASFNAHVARVNVFLDAFKSRSNKAALEAEVIQLTQEIRQVERQIRRIDSSVTCANYTESKALEVALDQQIKDAQAELNREQSAYLKKFFERINFYFAKFGSRFFSIGKEEELDNLGYQPVLSLVVKYNGTVIDPARLGAVFSESDRRALALSIFWAKVSILSDAERQNTIVVLDDPVTSFDDNRISTAIIQMRMEATTLRQLVILTHYHAFAKRWLEVERVGATLSFSHLVRDEKTTDIVVADEEEFLHSEQQKLYRKFIDYIEGRVQDSIASDLRLYLETEIRNRYRHQLARLALTSDTLSDVINALAENGIIDASVAQEAHFYREDLNGPHHILAARSREDWASLASAMLTFIYGKL